MSHEDGIALISISFFGIALMVIMAVLALRVAATYNAAVEDRDFEAAMYTAEAGLDVGLSLVAQDPTYATVAEGVDLSGKEAVLAAAIQLATDPTNVVSTPTGDYVIVRRADMDSVFSVGASPSWEDEARRIRIVEATIETATTGGCWPDGALIGKGLIEWGGGPVLTSPSSLHAANAIGNYNFKGSSGIFIDGDISVSGSIFNTTQSNLYGTMEPGADPLIFPSAEEISAWQTKLQMEAIAGGTIGTLDLSVPMEINAPLYVSGDIFLRSGGHLTINGPGVVYVSGRVELGGGSTLVNGSLLAVAGQFKQGGGTKYLLAGTASVEDSGLVSFLGNTTDAIIFEGAATGMQGVIYAARGGVKLTGAAALYGAAIAGGEVPYGQIKSGGGTTMTYPAGLLPASTWLPKVRGGPGGGCGLGTSLWFADAAITANGPVVISGGSVTYSYGSYMGIADVLTNSTFKDATASVDGDLVAGSAVTADPSKVTGTITANAGPVVQFPPNTEVEAWRADLMAQAQLGPTVGSQIFDADATLTAPIFINGELKMGGDTLTIQGPGVVYVTGKVTLSGGARLINHGAVLAGDLQMVFSGGSTYEVAGDGSSAGIVSFAQGVDKALELSGGSLGLAHGVAYAPYGGIKLSGGSAWVGALVAGGLSDKGKVEVSGGASVVFPPGMITNNKFLPGHEDPEPPETQVTLERRREL